MDGEHTSQELILSIPFSSAENERHFETRILGNEPGHDGWNEPVWEKTI